MISITSLYQKDLSYQEIGKLMGISKQRVHQKLLRLGLKRKSIINNPSPNKYEKIVAKKLRLLGYKVEHMNYNYPYDLLIDDYLKIEVKYRSYFSNKKYKYFKVKLWSQEFDYLIFTYQNEKNKYNFYIVPVKQINKKHELSFPSIPVKNQPHKVINFQAWNILPKPSIRPTT